ncbi:MAG: mannitol dehydrogenase family protein [Synergistaceae bacterium]|jgi:fructuronate reductase|nr:mannitol dehydrogenase family protein [Synergistaceae bacterium]
MLQLNRSGLERRADWEAAGVGLPAYDYAALSAHTMQHPRWLHFGAGNIFRAYIARLQHQLLNEGKTDVGIVVVAPYDYEIIEKVYRPHDNLALVAALRADGEIQVELVASITEAIRADAGMGRLREIAGARDLQLISLCITEKGYALTDIDGRFPESVRQEMEKGPDGAKHTMSLVAALMLERFRTCAAPVALLSLDNCSRNGEKLKNAVLTVARAWVEKGFAGGDFIAWLEDGKRVSFPWSMIDKITPRPSESVSDYLTKKGIEGMDLLVTAKGTFLAPFVNAEVPEYLVVEDDFPGGRPPLEDAGVYFVDRDTVNSVERMKVTTCLNPLHTALALFGCLLGYSTIASEMKDPVLKALVERIGYVEGMPVVTNPGIFSPEEFLREVLEERFPNPFIPDTPQRIATDTSQKIPIRFGETIKACVKRPDLSTESLTGIPLVIAAWFRYLLGVDDRLRPMEVSGDPMLPELRKGLEGVTAGSPGSYRGQLRPFLSNASLFGVDLYAAGLGEKIESLFVEMLKGENAVSNTLTEKLSENPERKS